MGMLHDQMHFQSKGSRNLATLLLLSNVSAFSIDIYDAFVYTVRASKYAFDICAL